MRVSNALAVLVWFCSFAQALEPRGEKVSSRQLPEKFLHWPFSPGENWRITNSYSGLEGHGNGIPFALDLQRVEGRQATQQSAVRAAASGTVIHAGPLGGYGNAVVIRHADGFASLYGHLDRVTVAVDTKVPALERLGIAGNTGHSTGAHIHFEVRDIQGVKRWQEGTFVKPEPILGHADFAGATPERPYPQAFGKPKSYSYALKDVQPTPEALARDIAAQLKEGFGTKAPRKDQNTPQNDIDTQSAELQPEPSPARALPDFRADRDGKPQDLIVGTWQPSDSDFVRLEFSKDGKLKVVSTVGGSKTLEGTYRFVDDQTVAVSLPSGNMQSLAVRVSKHELFTRDERGSVSQMKRLD